MWNDSDRQPRHCGAPAPRTYTPHNTGIGFDILRFESEACFVPDESFQLLDTIVDKVVSRINADTRVLGLAEKALFVSTTTSNVLTEMGFALWIPTNDLSDALNVRRTPSDHDRHIFDCDTGSMILLTVADALGMNAALVESTIAGHDPKDIVQHNFVQWPVGGGAVINWDMNARQACVAPSANQLPFQGKPLTTLQFWAYESSLRGNLWDRTGHYSEAVRDYQAAISKWPERPGAYNGLAWDVATKDFPERKSLSDSAMNAALEASNARPDANIMDTLACMYAYRGDYANAIATEEKAIELAPQKIVGDLKNRLAKFKASPPRDCTGEP
jgi:hypothetical protein